MQRHWLHGLRTLAADGSAVASRKVPIDAARRWVSSSSSLYAPPSSTTTDSTLSTSSSNTNSSNSSSNATRGPFQRRSNGVPAVSAARLVSNMHKKPAGKPSAREKAEVVAQLQELVARATGRHFEPNLDFLRHASRVLQVCKSREQLVAALPLCEIVENATVLHGTATMECVRIYQRLGRNREVVTLAEKLFKNDFFLMNPVLANAIQACSALGDVNKGFELFETAIERGTIPNLNVYSALLSLCGAAGDTTRVQVVLSKMKAAGLEMNNITYHNLMSAYSKGGHMDKAIELFSNLKDHGLVPDDHTYAILMDAYGENGDYETALALMNELKASSTMTPNLVHYNVILKACGKASKLATAFQLYEEMKERKIQPDLVTYITMMHAVFHGELGEIDTKKVKAALAGVGVMGVAFVPFIDFQEHYLTVLFCGSMVGSMGLAAYMNPDGVLRALYPNSDEPHNDSIIEAFFRRLREEDHCGRSMYLWREMLKFNISADPRVYDVLVRTCVKKRHPEMAFEAVFEERLPLTDSDGAFVLPLQTTVQFLHSLLAQRRAKMADTLFAAGLAHGAFADVFVATKNRHVYDLRSFGTGQVRSYTISKALSHLRAQTAAEAKISDEVIVPDVDFLVLHGYDLLDQLDSDNTSVRELFSMDEMKREAAGNNPGQYFFRLTVTGKKLKEFFATTKETQEQSLDDQLDGMGNHSIQVSCRVRAINDAEAAAGGRRSCISFGDDERTIAIHSIGLADGSNGTGSPSSPPSSPSTATTAAAASSYSCFDSVFSGQTTQETLFDRVGKPFVDDVLAGYNCTILAYGQTGSGKTFTTVGGRGETRGLIPRAMETIFDEMQRVDGAEFDVSLTASFIEVYQETLRDLLLPHNSKHLKIREEKVDGGVYVAGASEIQISNVASGLAILARGNTQRATGATLMNQESSRSHSVFMLTYTKKHLATRVKLRGKLLLVDLAGSEKTRKTAASGKRLEEAKHINRSLSALGNVINALTDGKSKYVPYRDSKLTRLLQSSLGGNAKTHLLLTCSSSQVHIDETLSTLRFGARAKSIRNTPHVNKERATSAAEYKELLTTLQEKIQDPHHADRRPELSADSCDGKPSDSCRKRSEHAPQCECNDPVCCSTEPEHREVLPGAASALLADGLIQEEINSLRRAVAEMQCDRHEAEHARLVAKAMMDVRKVEGDALRRHQIVQIEQQQANLLDADVKIGHLERQVAQLCKDNDVLESTSSHLRLEVKHLRQQQEQWEEGQSAEAEILRRRLDVLEKQAKRSQLELLAFQQMHEELRASASAKEQELQRLRDEKELLLMKLAAASTLAQSAPILRSPKQSSRPLTAIEFAPVHLRESGNTNSGMVNIQSWWSGVPGQPQPQQTHGDQQEPGASAMSPPSLQQSERRRANSTKSTGGDALDSEDSRLQVMMDAKVDERRCRSQGQSRPFRARLVGLLNSLEEETSSLKGMIDESKEMNQQQHRPVAAKGGAGRKLTQLPYLDTISSSADQG